MSMMLIQPGRSAATRHPKTGEVVTPIGYRRNGTAIWPVLGASSDDPDDPAYTGGGTGKVEDDDEDDEDEEEDDEDEDDDKSSKGKGKHAKDDEDDDEDDENEKPKYSQRDMDRMKNRMRAADKRSSELETRLRKLEDKGKKPEELTAREERERERENEKREAELRATRFENAFFRSSSDIQWVDEDDAFAAALRAGIMDDVTDEDGTIDRKALARSLRDLAKKKPHLVKTKRTQRVPADEKDDDDQRSVSTPQMNGRRRGQRGTSDRDKLKSRFPALNR